MPCTSTKFDKFKGFDGPAPLTLMVFLRHIFHLTGNSKTRKQSPSMASMRTPLRWLTRNSFGIWITISAFRSRRFTVDGFAGSSVLEVDQKADGRKALLDEGLILHQKGELEEATRAYTRLLEVRQLWLVLSHTFSLLESYRRNRHPGP